MVSALVLLAALGWVMLKFDEKGQFDGKFWKPFTTEVVWVDLILPGTAGHADGRRARGAVFALLFGAVFGIARLSDHRWISMPAALDRGALPGDPAAAADLLRLVDLRRLDLRQRGLRAVRAVVIGLTLYNGSVLAEVVRAGINSHPEGPVRGGATRSACARAA